MTDELHYTKGIGSGATHGRVFEIVAADGRVVAEAVGITAARVAARHLLGEENEHELSVRALGDRFALETVSVDPHGGIALRTSTLSRRYAP